MSVKGYKVFNPDWTCRSFQYEVSKTFEHEGDIKICGSGFHFCQKLSDCFNYYSFDSNNKIAEVEAVGLVKTKNNKSVTNKIRIIRELTWHEVLDLYNTGEGCVGRYNCGDFNNGNGNSGHFNNGDRNSGSNNRGDYNSGELNIGSFNAGCYNNGSWNTGSFNIGNYNIGDWNKCHNSTGYFNTIEQPFLVFNKPLKMSRRDFLGSEGCKILQGKYRNAWWICSKDMTDEERNAHPEYKVMNGYLKLVDSKMAYKIMWEKLSEKEKQAVKEIPNFNADIFEEITGINVKE